MVFTKLLNVHVHADDVWGPSFAEIRFDLENIQRIKNLSLTVDELNVLEISTYDETPIMYDEADDSDEAVEYITRYLCNASSDVRGIKMVVSSNDVQWRGCLRDHTDVNVRTESILISEIIKMERVLRIVKTGGTETIESIVDEILGDNRDGGEEYVLARSAKEDYILGSYILGPYEPGERIGDIKKMAGLFGDAVKFFYLDIFDNDSLTIKEALHEEVSDSD